MARRSRTYTSVEVCAGAGGQAVGLEAAEFEHLALVEIDPHACETLRREISPRNRPPWACSTTGISSSASYSIICAAWSRFDSAVTTGGLRDRKSVV